MKTRLILIVALGLALIGQSGMAQNPYAVTRTVNTSVITNYDVSQRIKLLQVLGVNAPDLGTVALTQLTEDRLKAQAAEALGMSLPDDAIGDALEAFAAQRQMSGGALRSQASRNGVADETLNNFVRTGILWRDLVNLRFRNRASPSEADVETVLNYAASASQESVFIREIAIPFAERGIEGSRALARKIIRDVRNGANFAGLARQYSRSRTAQSGGAVGWTPAARLPSLFAGQVLALQPGGVTAPIEVPAGVIVIQLADIREVPADENPDITATYVRLDIPVSDATNASEVANGQGQAATLISELDGCRDAETRIDEFGPASGFYGPDSLATIPASVGLTLAGLDADEAGVVALTETGISVVVLCRRSATADPEAIDNLQSQIFGQRMNSYANGFLQELLADAIITDK